MSSQLVVFLKSTGRKSKFYRWRNHGFWLFNWRGLEALMMSNEGGFLGHVSRDAANPAKTSNANCQSQLKNKDMEPNLFFLQFTRLVASSFAY